jgi:hypothetical protein
MQNELETHIIEYVTMIKKVKEAESKSIADGEN